VSDLLAPPPLPEGRSIPVEDGPQTPRRVRRVRRTLRQRLAALAARWQRDSSPSRRPPSTDAAAHKRPRRTGWVGARAGRVGARRSVGHARGAWVWRRPLCQGALPPRGARVAAAMVPQDAALGAVARTAAGNALDAPFWGTPGARHGRWGLAPPEVADGQLPRHHAKAALAPRMADGWGLLGREGSRGSHAWPGRRQHG
jgi:hypothetical protein